MGSNKQTTQSSQNQTYQASPTPLESQLNQTLSSNVNSTLPQAGQTQGSYLNLLNQGANAYTQGVGSAGLNGTPLGMAIGGVTPDQQNSIVQQSMRYLDPQFQAGGYLNSGAAASIQSRTAADLLGQSAQFNVTNAGNVLQGLLSGNTNTQQTTNQQAALLSNNLQGLRQITQSGTASGSTQSMNPFLSSLESSAGSSIGGSINPASGLSSLGGGVSNLGQIFGGSGLQNLMAALNPFGNPAASGNSFTGSKDVTNSNPFR